MKISRFWFYWCIEKSGLTGTWHFNLFFIPRKGTDELGRHTLVIPFLIGALVIPYKLCDHPAEFAPRCPNTGCPYRTMIEGTECLSCDPVEDDDLLDVTIS